MRLDRMILSLALAAAAGACNPIYYSPNTQNVLIAPQRGDLIAAGVANDNRVELQAAYAATDALAIQVNGGLFAPEELDNGDGGSGRFLEVGAGLFGPAGERFGWEIHALLGVGSVENDFPSTPSGNRSSTSGRSAMRGSNSGATRA